MIKQTLGIASLIAVTLYGFDISDKTIVSCKAEVDRYVMADFEEEYICPSLDGTSVDVCTHYSSKAASYIVGTMTRDGVGKGPHFIDGYYFSNYPSVTMDHSSHADFVGYRRVEDTTITATYSDNTTHRKFDYLRCLLDTGNEARVLTWYGMGGLHL